MLRQQIVLVLLAALMLVMLFVQGRHTRIDSGVTAFPIDANAHVRVLISGTVEHAGVYKTIDNKLTINAIKMANPKCLEKLDALLVQHPIKIEDGSQITVNCSALPDERMVTVQPMAAEAALVLGIPFSLNHAKVEDLELLPGVGPALARRIVEYRQKNGDFVEVNGLLHVEGIGGKKLFELKKHLKL